MRHIPAAIAVGTVVGALGLGGLAYASTTESSPATPVAKKHATNAKHALPGLLERAVYAQVIVEGKGHVTHTFVYERGKFTGISGGDLNLTRPDGVKVSVPISATTKFTHIPQASLAPGDLVRVVERDGATIRVFAHVPKTAPAPVTPVS